MGACRRGIVHSDEDEDDGGRANGKGDGAGPSSVRKAKKRSISQAELHITTGKAKKYQRLKHAVELQETDFDSDSAEENYESEDITEAAKRQKMVGKKQVKRARKKDVKMNSGPSLYVNKRKQRFVSPQKTSGSKAGGIQFEEIAEESTGDAVQLPLGKEFEQYLLEEVFNASKDMYTKEIDVPERFQIHEQYVTATIYKGDWTKEAYWIYDRAFGNSAPLSQVEDLKVIGDIDKEEIVQEIIFVLMQLHVQKCEIPVIGMYNFHGCMHLARRKESNDSSFNFEESKVEMKSFKALWWIFHWDRKWLLLQNSKSTQQETWKKRAMVKESESTAENGTLDLLIQALQDAESEQVIEDLDAKFNLHFPSDEAVPPKSQYKRPKRQSYYTMCCKSGLRQLVKQLGPTAEQLGENLQAMRKVHETLDCDVAPGETELSSASGQFTEVHRALEGARHMAAYELSCEPRARNYVRSHFFEHAVVSTWPTAKGKGLIDAFHEIAFVKCVQAKPVKKFDDGEWLLIQRGEEEELLEVTIELTQEIFDGVIMQGLQESYFSNASTEVAVLWNEQRKLILQEALSKMILPLLVKEMRTSLTVRAKAWVQSKCSNSLWKRVSLAPFLAVDPSPDAHLSSKATNDTADAKVLACCWGTRNPPTTFVMIDSFGELVDTLQTGYLNMYSGGLDQQLQRKTDDQERLQRFILLHQPDVIVVGATVNYACRQLKDTIAETVARAAEVNTRLTFVPTIYGDESLPLLYEKSQVSIMQLPKQPGIVRRAVALGRNLQNPLALISSLCNSNKDIVALSLHPMQRFLSAEELYSTIENVLITVTNQVGVDINLAVAHEWMFSPLQFVCGLGWKKASMLQQLIQELRWLPSRRYLLRHPFSLKDVIFRNCSGFLRIRRVAHAVSGLRKPDPLDDTRIHPDSYELAQNLAIYAFSNGQGSLDSETDMDIVEGAIVHIRQNPDMLTEATVTDFLNSLQEIEPMKLETLKDIRVELLCGFRDYRTPYTQPTQDEEFNWLTGEDDTSLASGKLVNVTVHKVFRHRIICILESGIRGVLEKENFTSNSSIDLSKVFLEGSSLTCGIANVLKDQFLVQLTCLESHMGGHDHNVDDSSLQRMSSSDEPIQKLGEFHSRDYNFKPRDVQHSLFHNVSVSDAMKALSDSKPGEVVFHPSSRGPTCLSMTMKCCDKVYLQKEIEEFEKDSTDLVTFTRLGGILKIDGRIFRTLDEVVTSYASPLMSKMNEVQELPEFRSGSDGEIRSYLCQKKEGCPESLVYCFSMCPNNRGAIAMSYIVDGDIKQETVDLYPEGYGFLSKMFRKIDTLVSYLKKTALAPPSDETYRWGGHGEGGDVQRGDGTGRGRGGRFGSGRRGRGREGRGGRGNSSTGKWGGNSGEDCFNSLKDAQQDAQGEGFNTFSGGGEADWTQSQNDNGGNSWVRGGRGSFRGRRGRGRGYGGRGREGGQWGQANDKHGEENFWSGGTGSKEDMDSLKATDTGAENNGWGAGNGGNDGWGTGNDVWKSAGEHSKQSKTDPSGWGVECSSRNPSVEEGNEWGGWNSGDVKATANNNTKCKSGGWAGGGAAENGTVYEKHLQDSKSYGQEGWGSDPLDTVSKDVKDATDFSMSNTGWDALESADIKASRENQWGGDAPKKKESTGDQSTPEQDRTRNEGRSSQIDSGWADGDGFVSQDLQTQETIGRMDKKPEFKASESQNDSGWGVADGSLDKGQTGGGWGVDNLQEKQGGGWNESPSKSEWEAVKSQTGSELGNSDGLLGKSPSVGGWGNDDSKEKNRPFDRSKPEYAACKGQIDDGWGGGEGVSHTGDGCRSDDSFTHKQGSGINDTQSNSGWGAPKGQIDSTWGGDGGSHERIEASCGWGSETQKQAIGKNDNISIPEWDSSKSQADAGWGGCNISLLDKSQSGGGWGNDDISTHKGNSGCGWGSDDVWAEKQSSGGSDTGNKLGGEASKRQSNSGWGGDDNLSNKNQTGDGWGNENVLTHKVDSGDGWGCADAWTDEQSGGRSDTGNKLQGEASKRQSNSGWGGDDSLSNKNQTGNGWGKDDISTHKADSGDGWGCADAWTDKQTRGGSDTGNKLGWEASKKQYNSGWGSEETGTEDANCPERGSFRGGRGWSRGLGRGGSSGWTQNEGGGRGRWSQGDGDARRGGRGRWSQGEDGWGRGGRAGWSQGEGGRGRWSQGEGGRGGRGSWSQGEGGRGSWSQGEYGMGRGGRGCWSQNEGDVERGGRSGAGRRGRGGRGQWSDNRGNFSDSTGRGGRGGWSQRREEDAKDSAWGSGFDRSRTRDGWNRDSGAENLGKASAADCNDWWASGGSQDTAQKEKGLENNQGAKSNSTGVAGEGWNEWARSSSEVGTVGALDTGFDGWGDPLDNTRKLPKQTTADDFRDGVESGWGTLTQKSECIHAESSKVNVALEGRSGWGADDSGWKSSKDVGDSHREADLNLSPGMQTGTENIEGGCKNTIKSNFESSGQAEPVTQEPALMEPELNCKEFSKESTEERGDGIWGACEDLIDSKEMEGLISQKGTFDNALESQNTNDAMQGEETVESVLRGLADATHGNNQMI